MKSKQILLCILSLMALIGCAPQTVIQQTSTPGELRPYLTHTPVITSAVTLPATPSPAPSPTPFIYSIVRGDTIAALAQRFGISTEALLAANPGLAPEALSVGQTLNIPVAGQNFTQAALATPAALEIGQARCLPSAGGSVCLVPLRNPSPDMLENVKLRMTVLDASGQALESQDAVLPLNILAPGQVLPAAAFFTKMDRQTNIQVQLLTAQHISANDGRYLRSEVQNLFVKIAWDGLSANLRGQIKLTQSTQTAARVWLVAVAYDAAGQITGYRRWEAREPLQPGSSLPFEMNIYSLGAPIERVEVQVEAARG